MSASPRTAYVMFADISGNAALFEKLGPKEAEYAVERCIKRMQRSIEGYNGQSLKIEGDEVLARFPNAEECCQAAIDMQSRVADLPPVSGLKLTIRIGLHAGPQTDDGQPAPEVITSAARVAGLARRHQILCSSTLVGELPEHCVISAQPVDELGSLSEHGTHFSLAQIHWPSHETGSIHPYTLGPVSARPVERLCVRYRDKAYLLDDKTTELTLGRDPDNKLIIEDRKASRHHGRIVRRGEGYFLIDTSTNGTFVTLGGLRESMVRRNEVRLVGKGKLCFGSSQNDPAAVVAEFEYL